MLLQKRAQVPQNPRVHGGSDPAGLCVLLTGMIYPEEPRPRRGQFGFGAMRKEECGARRDDPALLQKLQVRVPGNFAQRQQRARSQEVQFAFEVRAAI